MKRPITKLAAAAVIIIIAVLIGINHFGGSIDMASTAFAQMTEAIKRMPWVHVVHTEYDGETEYKREEWLSHELKILAGQEYNGMIVYWDYGNDEQYIYDPESDTITVSYRSGKSFEVASPYDYVTKHVEYMSERSILVVQQAGQHNEKDVRIYEFTIPLKDNHGDDYGTLIINMTVDSVTHLPIVGETKRIDMNGDILRKEQMRYDYPEELSLDIYDVGMPLTAKLINNLPTPDFKKLRQEYNRLRKEAPSQYIAIITTQYADTENIRELSIIYNTGRLQRINDFSNNGLPLGCSANTFDSLFSWVQEEGGSCDRRTDILYDGQYNYWHEYHNGKWHFDFQSKRYSPEANLNPKRALEDLAWPQINWKRAKIVENSYAKDNNLICVDAPGGKLINGTKQIPLRQVIYLNPQRDYTLQRIEIYREQTESEYKSEILLESADPEGIWGVPIRVDQVVEYAKTDTGLWYPKIIGKQAIARHHDGPPFEQHTFQTAYVNTDPEFPEGIFDPENLPK